MVNEDIISALSSLNLPISADVHIGSEDSYITFNFADERPSLRANNTDITEKATMQIHYFTKGNPLSVKNNIKTLLRNNGFTIVSTAQYYESDSRYYHCIVSVSKEYFI